MYKIDLTPKIEETTIPIEGIKKNTTIIQVTDSHLLLCDKTDDPQLRDYFVFARQWFLDNCTRNDDAHPNDIFEEHIKCIQEIKPDITVFTGDMVCAPTNVGIAHLADAFQKIGNYMYVPGNHDWVWPTDFLENGELTEENRQKAVARFESIISAEDFDFQVRELNGLLLIGINTSDYFITEKQLEQLRVQFERGMPCILFIHIPVYTEGLTDMCEQMWHGPVLTAVPPEILDKAAEHVKKAVTPPSKTTYTFLELISRSDTPLKAIFAGHLHFSHEAPLKNGVMQYVTDMGVNGTIRKINIVGEKKHEQG